MRCVCPFGIEQTPACTPWQAVRTHFAQGLLSLLPSAGCQNPVSTSGWRKLFYIWFLVVVFNYPIFCVYCALV